MNCFSKILAITTIGVCSQVALAVPASLVTHNRTDVESNAFIDGTLPSPFPTAPHSDRAVSWTLVRMACIGHVTNNHCKALIKMDTNTANVVDLGWLDLDLTSGDINPKQVQANGYTISVNGPGEVTLSKD